MDWSIIPNYREFFLYDIGLGPFAFSWNLVDCKLENLVLSGHAWQHRSGGGDGGHGAAGHRHRQLQGGQEDGGRLTCQILTAPPGPDITFKPLKQKVKVVVDDDAAWGAGGEHHSLHRPRLHTLRWVSRHLASGHTTSHTFYALPNIHKTRNTSMQLVIFMKLRSGMKVDLRIYFVFFWKKF